MRLSVALSVMLLVLIGTLPARSQVYNRLLSFKVGYSAVQLDMLKNVHAFNDTSETHQFELVTQMPSVSYSHDILLGNVISFSACAGWQYMNMFYDNQHFGIQYFFLSVEPRLTILQRKKFEYYFKFKAGVSFWTHDLKMIDGPTRRLFPERVNMFTGVTVCGLNLFLNDNWGINAELSVLSPEMIAVGATYRFWRGELPKIQGEEEEVNEKRQRK